MITTITGKNQVTVPAAIANRAGLRPGSRLDWNLDEKAETLIVRILPDRATLAAQLRGRGRKHQQHEGSAVARLVRERQLEDKEQD